MLCPPRQGRSKTSWCRMHACRAPPPASSKSTKKTAPTFAATNLSRVLQLMQRRVAEHQPHFVLHQPHFGLQQQSRQTTLGWQGAESCVLHRPPSPWRCPKAAERSVLNAQRQRAAAVLSSLQVQINMQLLRYCLI